MCLCTCDLSLWRSVSPHFALSTRFLMAQSYAGFIVFLTWISSSIPRPPSKRAVALAFLITKLTPNHVFCPDSSKGNEYPILTSVSTYLGQLVPATRHHSITILRQLPWISKPNRGGTIDRSLYFTQASVVILAWIDPASPIRKDLALRAAKNTRISIFNTKHSTSGHLSFTRSDVHVW